jgi:hypothetical protein
VPSRSATRAAAGRRAPVQVTGSRALLVIISDRASLRRAPAQRRRVLFSFSLPFFGESRARPSRRDDGNQVARSAAETDLKQ